LKSGGDVGTFPYGGYEYSSTLSRGTEPSGPGANRYTRAARDEAYNETSGRWSSLVEKGKKPISLFVNSRQKKKTGIGKRKKRRSPSTPPQKNKSGTVLEARR